MGKTKVISFRVDKKLLEQFDALTIEKSRTDAIKRLIVQAVLRNKKGETWIEQNGTSGVLPALAQVMRQL